MMLYAFAVAFRVIFWVVDRFDLGSEPDNYFGQMDYLLEDDLDWHSLTPEEKAYVRKKRPEYEDWE